MDLSLLQAIVRVVADVLEAQGLRVATIVVDQRLFNTFPRCPIVEYLQKFLFVFAFADLWIVIRVEPAIHDLVLLSTMQTFLHVLAAQVLEEAGDEAFLAEARGMVGVFRGLALSYKWPRVPLDILDILRWTRGGIHCVLNDRLRWPKGHWK